MAKRALWLTVLVSGLFILYWPTFSSMISIWWRSETFTHGFLVLPITGYLIWRNRHLLHQDSFQTDWRALPLLGLSGFAWLLAHLVDVLVIEQLAVVAMIPILVWMTFGSRTIKSFFFPLGILFFAVPMGEGLIYPLMQLTAWFTVGLLHLTGIPVFTEGTFISIPSGNWSIIAACSGLRYLIASLLLGVLYAYLSYRSLWRRLAFIALSAIVPIFANGIRAYLIVMIGHLSNMRLAVGIDHLIYGWLFFGFVMFLLFALGTLWYEEPEVPERVNEDTRPLQKPASARNDILILGLIMLATWPRLGSYIEHARVDTTRVTFQMPQGHAGGWLHQSNGLTKWKPHFIDASLEARGEFKRGTDQVGLYLALYGNTEGELINSQNVMVPQRDPVWRMPYLGSVRAQIAEEDVTVIEVQAQSRDQDLLIWYWYWINGHQDTNDYTAKLYEAFTLLSGNSLREAGVALYTPMGLKPDSARVRLQQFIDDTWPAITASLAREPKT